MPEPKILLYYAFAPVRDPEAARLWQLELCRSLGLRGRIIISPHGINGTVGGELDACKQYVRRTREFGPFSGLDVKWGDGTGFEPETPEPLHGTDRRAPWRRITDFPKLSVKVRDELVAFGIPDEVRVDASGVQGGGTRLSPAEVNALAASRSDLVFFDGRNAWEAEIGRFENAVVPDVRTTHGFIEQLDSGVFDDLKDRPVVTYCTGGVRCEILSAAMRERGFREVYQIDGGIVRYGEAFGNDGLWRGSLAVFDGRETVEFGADTAVVGRCAVCDGGAMQLSNCAEPSCRARFATCAAHHGTLCEAHGGSARTTPAVVFAGITANPATAR